MNLLDDVALERSSVVANSRMNRERRAVGVNSYERDLGLNPIAFLAERLSATGSTAWLDICCGRGCALIDAATNFESMHPSQSVELHGIDLVSQFADVPKGRVVVKLKSASIHRWQPNRTFDLITCVHGLHYIGDKLSVVKRAASWLSVDGLLLVNLDLANLRLANEQPMARQIARSFRDQGLDYNSRRRLLNCVGSKSVLFDFRYVGANDQAGPNYSGQEAVDSYYESRD